MKMALNGTTGKIRFGIKAGAEKEEVALTPDGSVSTKKWVHIAFTKNGDTGTLYIDGVQKAVLASMKTAPSKLGITTTNYIGKSQNTSDKYLAGKIDEFCIYNRALSTDEIVKLAASK